MFVVSVCVARSRSLWRINHSSRGVLPTVARRCVWSTNLENKEAKARYRAVKIQPQCVVTPGKQTQGKETNKAPLLPLDSPDDVGSSCPRDCFIENVCVMQRKVVNKVQTIHYQTGLTTASRLECQTLHSKPLCYRSVDRILRTIPVADDLRCRVTRVVVNIWQYTSAEMIRI
jgi:hypothetical protein